MKYMLAIGQHQRLSLANGLLQMFSQADKLRTVSRGMPGVQKKKKKDIRISKLNANPPNEYSNNRIFWSSPTAVIGLMILSVEIGLLRAADVNNGTPITITERTARW